MLKACALSCRLVLRLATMRARKGPGDCEKMRDQKWADLSIGILQRVPYAKGYGYCFGVRNAEQRTSQQNGQTMLIPHMHGQEVLASGCFTADWQ